MNNVLQRIPVEFIIKKFNNGGKIIGLTSSYLSCGQDELMSSLKYYIEYLYAEMHRKNVNKNHKET